MSAPLTLATLKALVEANAVNLASPVTIVEDHVEFTIQEMYPFYVKAHLENGEIVEVVDDDITTRYNAVDYAMFLRCEAE